MKKPVLVGGADGWLGLELIARLKAQGEAIVILKEPGRETPPALQGLSSIEVDLRGKFEVTDQLRNVRVVFNCAGAQHPARTRELYAVNRDGVANLFRQASAAGIESFVHVSSMSVVGPTPPGPEPRSDRRHECRPKTHYARSKYQGEKLLLNLARNSKTRVSILRPAVFIGTNPSRNMASYVEMVAAGRGVIFGREGFYRSYVRIDKVVTALLAAEKGPEGPFFVADTPPLTTKQVEDSIAQAAGHVISSRRFPVFLSRIAESVAWLAGCLGWHLRLVSIAGEFGRHYVCDGREADAAFGLDVINPRKTFQRMAAGVLATKD